MKLSIEIQGSQTEKHCSIGSSINACEQLKADLRGKDNEIEDLKARIKYLKQFEPKEEKFYTRIERWN